MKRFIGEVWKGPYCRSFCPHGDGVPHPPGMWTSSCSPSVSLHVFSFPEAHSNPVLRECFGNFIGCLCLKCRLCVEIRWDKRGIIQIQKSLSRLFLASLCSMPSFMVWGRTLSGMRVLWPQIRLESCFGQVKGGQEKIRESDSVLEACFWGLKHPQIITEDCNKGYWSYESRTVDENQVYM